MSSSDEDRPNKRRKISSGPTSTTTTRLSVWLNIKNVFDQYTQFLTTPDAPIIFSSWARLVFHSIGIMIILVILFQLLQSCSSEIQELYNYEVKLFEEKARECHYSYIDNNCGPLLKGAYWQSFCDEWDKNMQAHQYVTKSKIATQVFGELMNGFVEPLSLKAMLITCLLVFGFFIVSSFIIL